jgi:hypothetical protein
MKDARFVFGENIVPLKAPIDSAGTAYATPYVDLKNALHATFFIYFGVITATSADQSVVVTMECSTAASSNATEVAIPFSYRLSGATGANSWGAITAATASGVSVATTDDNKMLAIDVDPAALPKLHGQDDVRFVRAVVGIDAGGTVTLNSAWAELDPRYPQLSHLSAT